MQCSVVSHVSTCKVFNPIGTKQKKMMLVSCFLINWGNTYHSNIYPEKPNLIFSCSSTSHNSGIIAFNSDCSNAGVQVRVKVELQQ